MEKVKSKICGLKKDLFLEINSFLPSNEIIKTIFNLSKKFRGVLFQGIRDINLKGKCVNNKNILKILTQFENLTNLDLSNNQIGPKGAEYISKGNLNNLTNLDLSNNQIGPKGIGYISKENLNNLTNLNL